MRALRADVERLVPAGSPWRQRARLLFSYRLMPVVLLRMAQGLRGRGIPLLPDALSMLNFFLFGLEVGKQCSIGPGLVIAHPQGVVLGASRIGRNATIFSGVTLGARGLGVPFREAERPVIGDNVVLGSGAKVLGSVRVGDDAVVGANAVVTTDVPEACLAVGIPAVIKPRGER